MTELRLNPQPHGNGDSGDDERRVEIRLEDGKLPDLVTWHDVHLAIHFPIMEITPDAFPRQHSSTSK